MLYPDWERAETIKPMTYLYALGASEQIVIKDNGFIVADCWGYAGGSSIYLNNCVVSVGREMTNQGNDHDFTFIPVKKGDILKVIVDYYNGYNGGWYIQFIPFKR